MKIYLCGPINGCNDDEAKTWRDWFKNPNSLSIPFVTVEYIDPMIRDYRGMEEANYREIVDLDKRDVAVCDVVVVMFTRPSVGTAMEVLLAWSRGIPVVVIDESGSPLSPWILYHSTAIVDSKQAAAEKIRSWFRVR